MDYCLQIVFNASDGEMLIRKSLMGQMTPLPSF